MIFDSFSLLTYRCNHDRYGQQALACQDANDAQQGALIGYIHNARCSTMGTAIC